MMHESMEITDRLYGRLSNDDVEKAIEVLRKDKFGKNASIIGEVTDTNPGKAVLRSVIGGKRILDKLAGEQLPRIC